MNGQQPLTHGRVVLRSTIKCAGRLTCCPFHILMPNFCPLIHFHKVCLVFADSFDDKYHIRETAYEVVSNLMYLLVGVYNNISVTSGFVAESGSHVSIIICYL